MHFLVICSLPQLENVDFCTAEIRLDAATNSWYILMEVFKIEINNQNSTDFLHTLYIMPNVYTNTVEKPITFDQSLSWTIYKMNRIDQ